MPTQGVRWVSFPQVGCDERVADNASVWMIEDPVECSTIEGVKHVKDCFDKQEAESRRCPIC